MMENARRLAIQREFMKTGKKFITDRCMNALYTLSHAGEVRRELTHKGLSHLKQDSKKSWEKQFGNLDCGNISDPAQLAHIYEQSWYDYSNPKRVRNNLHNKRMSNFARAAYGEHFQHAFEMIDGLNDCPLTRDHIVMNHKLPSHPSEIMDITKEEYNEIENKRRKALEGKLIKFDREV